MSYNITHVCVRAQSISYCFITVFTPPEGPPVTRGLTQDGYRQLTAPSRGRGVLFVGRKEGKLGEVVNQSTSSVNMPKILWFQLRKRAAQSPGKNVALQTREKLEKYANIFWHEKSEEDSSALLRFG